MMKTKELAGILLFTLEFFFKIIILLKKFLLQV